MRPPPHFACAAAAVAAYLMTGCFLEFGVGAHRSIGAGNRDGWGAALTVNSGFAFGEHQKRRILVGNGFDVGNSESGSDAFTSATSWGLLLGADVKVKEYESGNQLRASARVVPLTLSVVVDDDDNDARDAYVVPAFAGLSFVFQCSESQRTCGHLSFGSEATFVTSDETGFLVYVGPQIRISAVSSFLSAVRDARARSTRQLD